jgi:phthalate 4,5-cis-dihydrodiol dehydrogenase
VSCENGDIRQSPDGLFVYTIEGMREVPCAPSQGRGAELLELYEAITEDRAVFPDGRWGKATLEVVLAILQSSREKREIALSHQIAYPS